MNGWDSRGPIVAAGLAVRIAFIGGASPRPPETQHFYYFGAVGGGWPVVDTTGLRHNMVAYL